MTIMNIEQNLHINRKLLSAFIVVVVILCSGYSNALMLQLEESEVPPAMIEMPQVEELDVVDTSQNTSTSSSAQQPGWEDVTNTSAGKPQPQTTKPDAKKYKGVFKLWEPIDKFLPLKSATVDMLAVSFANDLEWKRTPGSHNNKFGNYFIEAGRSFGSIKDFNLKIQSSKQLKNQYARNEFIEMRANIFGLDTVFSKKSSLSASVGSMNSTLGTTWGVKYKLVNGLSFGLNSIETKTSSSSAVAPTINRQLGYSIGWDRKKYRLNLTNSATRNFNNSNGSVTKNTQSVLQISVPVSNIIDINLRLQLSGTNNAVPGSTSTKDDKFTKALGVMYRPSNKMSIAYNRTLTDNESVTQTAVTNYGIVSNEYLMNYAFSNRLKLQSKSTISSNESTGKTTDYSNTILYNHQKFNWLPGATTFAVSSKFSNPSGGTQKTKTSTVNMPLTYLKGKLGINLHRTQNQQFTISAGTASQTDSLTHKVGGSYKITSSLSLNSSVNQVKSSSQSGGMVQNIGANRTYDDNVTYTIKNPLSKRIGPLKKLDFKVGKTANRNAIVMPSMSLTTTDATKQSGDFLFNSSNWNGTYSYSWGHARQNFGMATKVRQHRISWNISDILGCRVTANYTTGRQVVGLSSSGIFRAERTLNDKSNMYLNYEFSRNQDNSVATNNKFMKYLEAGMQMRF